MAAAEVGVEMVGGEEALVQLEAVVVVEEAVGLAGVEGWGGLVVAMVVVVVVAVVVEAVAASG